MHTSYYAHIKNKNVCSDSMQSSSKIIETTKMPQLYSSIYNIIKYFYKFINLNEN